MIIASNLFLLYFLPVFLLLYWAAPYKARNYIALGGSLVFYAWGAPVFAFVLIASSVVDYVLSLQIVRSGKSSPFRRRQWLLALGIGYNLGLLLYFKYVNFFIDNWNELLEVFGYVGVEWTKVVIPLGISFFTFQKISYLVDISRGLKEPPSNILDYLFYVSFFPQLVAGPIVRYNEIADQIRDRRTQDTIELRWTGMLRFCIGLGRKVLIANPLALYVEDIIQIPDDQLSFGMAWLGPLIFAFVVYHDFGGYSDMAIGLGRMMGFRIPENFNNPYVSPSITEFWRRWHISLTGWFRIYLFWPMRKFAVRKWMLSLNLWLVFLLVGFWHGAAWTFVLFGAWHGGWVLMEHFLLGGLLKKLPRVISIPWVFLIVVVGIVPFVSPDMTEVVSTYSAMFGFSGPMPDDLLNISEIDLDLKFWLTLVVAAFFSFYGVLPRVVKFQQRFDQGALKGIWGYIWFGFALLILILSIGELARMGFQPFIYFMF